MLLGGHYDYLTHPKAYSTGVTHSRKHARSPLLIAVAWLPGSTAYVHSFESCTVVRTVQPMPHKYLARHESASPLYVSFTVSMRLRRRHDLHFGTNLVDVASTRPPWRAEQPTPCLPSAAMARPKQPMAIEAVMASLAWRHPYRPLKRRHRCPPPVLNSIP